MSTAFHDILVVGAGMAGSTIAARCAQHGLDTALLEFGPRQVAVQSNGGAWQRVLNFGRDQHDGRWPDPLLFRRREGQRFADRRAVLGIGMGGSGAIYGAALGRARRDDFTNDWQPGAWQDGAASVLRNDWPVDFDTMQKFYGEAEQLLEVAGTPDPLDDEDKEAGFRQSPSLSPAHALIVETLQANGMHPYRMHVGIRYRPGCHECQGLRCLRDCKSDPFNRVLQPAIEAGNGPRLMNGREVVSVSRTSSGFSVEFVRPDGAMASLAAARVVLAAGALNSPRILQASKGLWTDGCPPLVGAGLMFHSSEIFAVSGFGERPLHGARKAIAFRDHYRAGAAPLAEVQSLGAVAQGGMVGSHLFDRAVALGLPPGQLTRLATRAIGAVAARKYATSELFTAAIEDLPSHTNRVETVMDSDGNRRIAVTYSPLEEIFARIEVFRDLVGQAFSPLEVDFLSKAGEPNLGHPMGTCRMGEDPSCGVVDGDCEVFGQPGLFVADASVFPSSLGINPGLTVTANALRIAAHLCGDAG